MEQAPADDRSPIAVVGMACRFPGADDVNAFWANLLTGVDAVSPVPRERFDVTPYLSERSVDPGRTVSRHGGFLTDAFGFDAAFFGISPTEATDMDPQQRLLLHVTWESLECAGIRPSSLAGSRGGVFVGQATAEYGDAGSPNRHRDVHEVVGNRLRAVTAGRVSYALDLRGPSVVMDTACSSSLVAVHAARQSLLTEECDLAIAAGVNIVLAPDDAIAYSQGGMLSPGGRCRFGAADGDGFVRSDGVGAVVLKRLSDAERDGDPVLALLLGSAVTNDGRASGLLLHPSVDGQVHMIEEACRSAGVSAGELDYVEAHGTGTSVGDSVELRALAAAFASGGGGERSLLTGSVKSNIGHAEAAAGIAGLIKSVLIAHHGEIPASLHCGDPHPLLTDDGLPVRVVGENVPVRPAGPAALLGVSSFGLSGTNAHVVVGAYVPDGPGAPTSDPDTPVGNVNASVPDPDYSDSDAGTPHLLVLTAKSRAALLRLADDHAAHLEPGGAGHGQSLRDVCATAAACRDPLPQRLWVVAATHADMAERLRALAAGRRIPQGGLGEAGFGEPRRTVFVFPGQGSQWLGMGRDLYASSPAFRTQLLACDAAIGRELGWSVVDVLHADDLPTEVERVQPVLWALEVALTAAWRALGVTPDVCVGHSMGEVAAAYVAGALSLQDAASVICRRSRLMQRTAGLGAMTAVELGAADAASAVAPYEGAVCVAAENSPTASVLAGKRDALEELCRSLSERGVLCRPVKVDVASHSPLMDTLHDDLLAELARLTPSQATTPLFSTVTGEALRGPELTAPYWADNLRSRVRFTGSVEDLARSHDSVFVEISPHPVLKGALDEILAPSDSTAVASLRRDHDGGLQLLCAAGQLFASGADVDWSRRYPRPFTPVPLPHYSWDLTQYRYPSTPPPASGHVRQDELADLGLPAQDPGVVFHGMTPVPPAVFLATALKAAGDAAPGEIFALDHVELGTEPVEITADQQLSLRTTVGAPSPDGSRHAAVDAVRGGSGSSVPCATALVRPVGGAECADAPDMLDAALGRCRRYVSADAFYRGAERQGLYVGEALRSVQQLWRRDGEAVARMRHPKAPAPAAWEAALQPLLAAVPASRGVSYVPEAFDSVQLFEDLPDEFWSTCRLSAAAGAGSVADVTAIAPDGRVLASFAGIRLRRLAVASAPTASGIRRSRLRARAAHIASRLSRRHPAREPASPAHLHRPDPAVAVTAGEPPHTRSTRPSRPVRDVAAAALGMEPAELDDRRPLSDYGLDSLMASKIRLQLSRDHGVEVTAGQLLGGDALARIEELSGQDPFTRP
ncbi:type I polyketide synthase [Streptomyces sp. NPDC005374]|uniref:type I polyketide synthase n=1 Tax=Streptomyces sp. NPDC005374 TaxID=3364713 RepID=UPI0036CD4600